MLAGSKAMSKPNSGILSFQFAAGELKGRTKPVKMGRTMVDEDVLSDLVKLRRTVVRRSMFGDSDD